MCNDNLLFIAIYIFPFIILLSVLPEIIVFLKRK